MAAASDQRQAGDAGPGAPASTARPADRGILGGFPGLQALKADTSSNKARTLDLSDLELTALPDLIAQLTSLTEPHLSDNELTAVADRIGELTGLAHLDLSGNPDSASPVVLPGEYRKNERSERRRPRPASCPAGPKQVATRRPVSTYIDRCGVPLGRASGAPGSSASH